MPQTNSITGTSPSTGASVNVMSQSSTLPYISQNVITAMLNDTTYSTLGALIQQIYNACPTTPAIKPLLQDSNDAKNIHRKIATYAGVSMSTAPTFISASVDVDKLTFYIMFRLPFADNIYNSYYGDPLDSSSSYGLSGHLTQSWSYQANQLRVSLTSGLADPSKHLKLLNAAGEQVVLNSDNKYYAQDDQNNILGDAVYDDNQSAGQKYTGIVVGNSMVNRKGYDYLGIPLTSIFNAHVPTQIPVLNPAATELSMLFDFTDDYNKIPPYFFLVGMQENPYTSHYWLNTNVLERSRSPHFPSTTSAQQFNMHLVSFTLSGSSVVGLIGTDNPVGQVISATGTIGIGSHLYTVNLLPGDSLTHEGAFIFGNANLSLSGSTIQLYNNNYVAKSSSLKEDFQISGSNDSGVTIGTGMDTGTAFHGYFKVTYNISVNSAASGSFKFYSGPVISSAIQYSQVSSARLKNAINQLLLYGFADSAYSYGSQPYTNMTNLVTVTTNTPNGAIKNYTVVINREKAGAITHKIFCCTDDLTASNPNVTITPNNTNHEGWSGQTDVINKDWYIFTNVMNYSFSNSPSASDDWLCQSNFTTQQSSDFEKCVKLFFGCNRGRGYAIYQRNLDLMKQFQFTSYIQHVRAVYNEFFLKKYYHASYTVPNVTNPIPNTVSSIEGSILNNSNLKTMPNQAELYIMASIIYYNPSIFSSKCNALINAINAHNRDGLISIARSAGFYAEKRRWVNIYLGYSTDPGATGASYINITGVINNIHVNLYRNVE